MKSCLEFVTTNRKSERTPGKRMTISASRIDTAAGLPPGIRSGEGAAGLPSHRSGLGPFRPLSRHFLFHTKDIAEASAVLSKLYRPHGLAAVGRSASPDVTAHFARIGGVSLSYLHYGTEVSMEPRRPECLDTFIVVQIPLAGKARVSCGSQEITSSPELGAVISATAPMRMRWDGRCEQITLRIDRNRLERHCGALLGKPVVHPIEFALGLGLSEGDGARWRGLVMYLAAELDRHDSVLATPLMETQFEQVLMTGLLTMQPNNYHDELRRPASPAAPYYVRRAEEYIEANAYKAITIEDLAEIANVSTRSIYEGFRRFRGLTPNEYLRSIRLERAQRALREADPSTSTVTEIAAACGFTHLGRFGQEYKRRYGETPATTLSRQPRQPRSPQSLAPEKTPSSRKRRTV